MSNKRIIEDFIFDNESNIYVYPQSYDYKYSDGDDVENKILNILKSSPDNSSGSDYLKKCIIDWPTEYHFSEYRTNLLRHFNFVNKSVLELGAGCGAG